MSDKKLKLVKKKKRIPEPAAQLVVEEDAQSAELTVEEAAEAARFREMTAKRAARRATIHRLIARLQEQENVSNAA